MKCGVSSRSKWVTAVLFDGARGGEFLKTTGAGVHNVGLGLERFLSQTLASSG